MLALTDARLICLVRSIARRLLRVALAGRWAAVVAALAVGCRHGLQPELSCPPRQPTCGRCSYVPLYAAQAYVAAQKSPAPALTSGQSVQRRQERVLLGAPRADDAAPGNLGKRRRHGPAEAARDDPPPPHSAERRVAKEWYRT